MRFSILHHSAAVIVALASNMALVAEAYPLKPIRLVTALPAGNDAYVRVLAARFSEQMRQPVLVDNRIGGSFVPSMQAVSGAAPDGHTLLVYSALMLITKSVQPGLPFDPIADFAPAAKIYEGGGGMLLVRADSPFKSMQDVIAQAKAAPGKLNHGGSLASFGHLNAASFLSIVGAKGFHVPYKTGGDDLPALLRGDIDFSFVVTTVSLPQVLAGKFRALAVTSGTRMRALPEVPTLLEMMKNDLLVQDNWSGLAAPARTPAEIVGRLYAETVKALADPALRKVIEAGGNEAAKGESPEQFAAFIRRDFGKWREIVKLSGIKTD